MVKNTEKVLETLKVLGAEITPVEIGWTDEIIQAAQAYWAYTWVSSFSGLLKNHRNELTDYAIWFIENSSTSTPSDFNQSLQVAVNMYNEFRPLMDKYDLFVCPTLSTTQIPAEFTWPEAEITINELTQSCIEERWSLTYPFNMLSRCPVLSLPSGVTSNGVPSGVQFIGRTDADKKVFEAAKAYEAASPELFN